MSGIRILNRVTVSKNGVRNSRCIVRTGGALAATLMTLGALGLGGVTPAFAQSPQYDYSIIRSNILRDTNSDGVGDTPVSGYGVFGLGETEPNNVTPAGQSSDAFAVSRWTSVDLPGLTGVDGLYVATVSSGFFYSQPDSIVGFVVGLPTGQTLPTPNTLSVRRNVVLQGAPLSTSNYDTFGLGWVNDSGLISFRTDSGSGGNTTFAPNAVVQQSANDHGYVLAAGALTPPSGSTLSVLAKSGTVSVPNNSTLSVPSIGEDTVSFFTTFSRHVGAATTNLTPGLSPNPVTLSPVGQLVQSYTSPADTRGSVTYNSTAGLAAVYDYDGTNVTGVRVFKVAVDGNGVVTVSKLNGTTPSTSTALAVTGDVQAFPSGYIGTNYFSRTGFAGTHQIAMNENGGIRKAYLFNEFNGTGYNGWTIAADSGTSGTGDFITDNPLSSVNELGASSPGLDNDGNIYFSATSHISSTVDPITQQTVYDTSQAVFKAANTPNGWVISQPIRVSDDYTESRTDANGTVTTDYKVLFIPVQVASSDLNNANCRYNSPASIGPAAVQRVDGDRTGVVVQALVAPILSVDPVTGEQTLGDPVEKYLLVSPGNTP